jgi:putative hydrolase of the HAD superfamily
MKQYEHIFFDLDHTLWDFEKNSNHTMRKVYEEFELAQKGISDFDLFYEKYHIINEEMWAQFRNKTLSRNELRWKRMYKTLAHYQIISEEMSHDMSDCYLDILPKKKNVFPFAIEILQYCRDENYTIHLITNGFELTQYEKIKNAGIDEFIDKMITSEQAMSMKPHKEIFEYAFLLTGAKANNSIMIGDSYEADIQGAKTVNMDQVYFNPHKIAHQGTTTFEISCLSEIKNIL